MADRTKAAAMKSEYHQGDWSFFTQKNHILASIGQDRERFEEELELPQTPEMVFANNMLRIDHRCGVGIEFTALEALRLVDAKHDLFKVAVSDAWKESRLEDIPNMEVIKPFDWTYSTDYKGTVLSRNPDQTCFLISTTEEKIDIEQLKKREKILFYDDVVLFEDELSDNGSSTLRVKIRVMPSCFFILLRFFMRVDDVLIRLNDTRFHHQFGTNYILREYTSRDEKIENIMVKSHHILLNPDDVSPHLTIREEQLHKLIVPDQ